MARITKQDVWRVASEIDSGGDKPTVLEVRKRLGAGSYTTITAALREWVKPGSEEETEVDEVPESVAEKVEQFGVDLYGMIYRIVQEQFYEQRAEYDSRIKSLECEKAELVQIADTTESSLDEANTMLEKVKAELAKCLSDGKVLESRLDDTIKDKERAIFDCAAAQKESGILRGRLEVYEIREAKPVKKKTAVAQKDETPIDVIQDQNKG